MIGMLECFTVKTHPILMKFKRRNVYLWIKVHKDLLLTLSEILTAFFFFLREKERESAREGKTPHLVRSCEWISVSSRQAESSWVFWHYLRIDDIQLKSEDKVASERLPLVKGWRWCADSPSQLQGDVSTCLEKDCIFLCLGLSFATIQIQWHPKVMLQKRGGIQIRIISWRNLFSI